MRNKLDEWDAAMAKPEGEARRAPVPGVDDGLEDFVALMTDVVGKEEAEAADARIRAAVEERCAHLYYQDDGDGRPIPKGFGEWVDEERARLAARSRFQRYADAIREKFDNGAAIVLSIGVIVLIGYVNNTYGPIPDEWAEVIVFDWWRMPVHLYEWLTG